MIDNLVYYKSDNSDSPIQKNSKLKKVCKSNIIVSEIKNC